MKEKEAIGGQAVLDGVMMRNRDKMVIACRDQQGKINITHQKLSPLADRHPFWGWFFFRGIVAFFESMIIGVRALNISTELVFEGEDQAMGPVHTAISVFLGLAIGIGLFFLLPTFLVRYLPSVFPVLNNHPLMLNLAEGILRIALFVSYIVAISLWGEIKAFFAYHGAEHKVINCLEAGEELVVEKAEKHSVQHLRCGTSYLLIVMVVSILLFSFFGWPSLWQRFLIRLALLPVVAGTAYEIIRWSSRSKIKCLEYVVYPGLWLQKLTTNEPDRSQIEVALASLKGLLGMEGPPSAEEVEEHVEKTR